MSQAIFDLPLTMVSEFMPSYPLGHIGCNFDLYGKCIFAAAVRSTHSLISLNQILALFMPITYKQYHTRAVATWLCVGTWVYVHIFLLPGLVMDDMYNQLDDGSSQVNVTAQQTLLRPRCCFSRSNHDEHPGDDAVRLKTIDLAINPLENLP